MNISEKLSEKHFLYIIDPQWWYTLKSKTRTETAQTMANSGIHEKSWENHEKFMRNSWKSHENVVRRSWENHGKSWESDEKVMRKSWENHKKILKKFIKKSWERHKEGIRLS